MKLVWKKMREDAQAYKSRVSLVILFMISGASFLRKCKFFSLRIFLPLLENNQLADEEMTEIRFYNRRFEE